MDTPSFYRREVQAKLPKSSLSQPQRRGTQNKQNTDTRSVRLDRRPAIKKHYGGVQAGTTVNPLSVLTLFPTQKHRLDIPLTLLDFRSKPLDDSETNLTKTNDETASG